jgi:histidine ammonia-lyase
MPGKEALKICGLKPLELEAGEGIALVAGSWIDAGRPFGYSNTFLIYQGACTVRGAQADR